MWVKTMSARATSAAGRGRRIWFGEDAPFAAYLGLAALNLVVLIDLAVRNDSSVLHEVTRALIESVGSFW